jgi:hypothetical protein
MVKTGAAVDGVDAVGALGPCGFAFDDERLGFLGDKSWKEGEWSGRGGGLGGVVGLGLGLGYRLSVAFRIALGIAGGSCHGLTSLASRMEGNLAKQDRVNVQESGDGGKQMVTRDSTQRGEQRRGPER